MKMLFTSARASRASGSDDNLGRGMDTALTVLAFLGIGLLIDIWLGTRPIFTIGLVVFAAVGCYYLFVWHAVRDGRRSADLRRARKETLGTRAERWLVSFSKKLPFSKGRKKKLY